MMPKHPHPDEKKFFVSQDFLLSPEAAPVRAVAESIYPFYLRAAFKAGDKLEFNPVPVLDDRFMNSHQARWVRILAETTYAQIMMKQLKVHHTVVFFGSSQIPETSVAEERLNEVVSSGDQQAIKQAEKIVEFSAYYEQARQLSARLTRWSMEEGTPDNPQPFVVCTGGGPSMMEAGNRWDSTSTCPTIRTRTRISRLSSISFLITFSPVSSILSTVPRPWWSFREATAAWTSCSRCST